MKGKTLVIIFLLNFTLCLALNAQWARTYGGSDYDWAVSIQQTSDGGYIVAGETISFGAGNRDVWILKLASNGTIEWQMTYGGNQSEEASSIQQTIDGGYVVAGKTISFGAGYRYVWSLKLASDGTIEWQKTYGGNQSEEASSIQQTIDGGYIVAGYTESFGAGFDDLWVLKLSSLGDIDSACGFISESNAEVSDADVIPTNTDITPEDTDITPKDTNITPYESRAVVYSLCSGQHTLSLSAGSGGTTIPQPGTYTYNHATRITISAVPDDEYKFSEWSGDVSSTSQSLSTTMDSDKSINANFSAVPSGDGDSDGDSKGGGICFIATAAYGSPLHPNVRILRDLKDKYLLSSKLGREFVDFYYKYSPSVSNMIAKHKPLRVIVQINLTPFVIFSYSMVNLGPIVTGGILLLILVLPIFFIYVTRRR